jgi:hypothetical protein
VSLDNRVWTDWQLVGVPDGVAEITNFIYEVRIRRSIKSVKNEIPDLAYY